ncbi:MAG: NADH-quinone oxidoreductase subunit J [Candidatus Abyssubacteria bacterium]
MALVAYLLFGSLAGATGWRAWKSDSRLGRGLWGVCAFTSLLIALMAAWRGIADFPGLLFYFFGLICVFAALRVIVQPNPVHCTIWLITVFLFTATLFILKQAEFLAAVQVIIYAGGIMVLYVFIIIFVEPGTITEEPAPVWMTGGASLVGLALLGALVWVASRLKVEAAAAELPVYRVQELGESLYFTAIVPFEATSLVLLVALVGAALIGKAERD